MHTGKLLFAQLMEQLPEKRFARCVARYGGHHKVKSFSCTDQFLCMAFAQLTFRESLRDIEACLRSQAEKLYHMGLRSQVSRNTLANANATRDWRIYADFAQRLIGIARGLYAHEPFGVDLANTAYALDSTTIDLSLSLFPWAPFRTTKAAVKLHTLLDLCGNIPSRHSRVHLPVLCTRSYSLILRKLYHPPDTIRRYPAMPHHAKGDVILRQWEMPRLIPAFDHPGKSAPELATSLDLVGFRVTRRTVERDLENLQRGFPLACDTDARPQRWRWQKQRTVDIPGMEAAEAMALFMMHDAMAAYLPSCFLDALQRRFTQANTTLKALARSGSRIHWADRVRVIPSHVVLKPPRIAPKIIESLQRALLNDIAIEADYRSHQDAAPKRRLLYPRGLILRGSTLYLIAHHRNGDTAPHHYAVQRFTSVRLKELEPWPEGAFSLDAYLKDGKDQFGDGRDIRLKARISPELNRILRDTPLSPDMHIGEESTGRLILTATVRDTWSLHTWILGHAQHVEIEQPAALRQLIAQRLNTAAAQYA